MVLSIKKEGMFRFIPIGPYRPWVFKLMGVFFCNTDIIFGRLPWIKEKELKYPG